MFKRWLLLAALGTAIPAHAATQYYVGPTGGAAESLFGAALLTRGLRPALVVNLTGELSGTTITDIGPTGVDVSASSALTVNGTQAEYISSSAGNFVRIDSPSGVYAIGIHLKAPILGGGWNYG